MEERKRGEGGEGGGGEGRGEGGRLKLERGGRSKEKIKEERRGEWKRRVVKGWQKGGGCRLEGEVSGVEEVFREEKRGARVRGRLRGGLERGVGRGEETGGEGNEVREGGREEEEEWGWRGVGKVEVGRVVE